MKEDTLFGEDEYLPPPERVRASKATPAPCGSGPDGETCKTCDHSVRTNYHNKYYWKCSFMKPWSHGAATDIRLKWDACSFWSEKLVVPGEE